MKNFQRLAAWLFHEPIAASKPISFMDMREIYSESQACYSRMRAALIAWRLEIEGMNYRTPPSDSSASPASSLAQKPDTIDEFLMTLGRDA